MTKPNEPNNNSVYRIRISGKLKESWSNWFDGMAIESEMEANETPVTTLTGPVTDQSALHGLLDKIRDLGLQLLLVEKVEPEQESTGTTQELK